MTYDTKQVTLKNGVTATFRSPAASDAAKLIEFMKTAAGETPYLMRYPEEVTMTVEREIAFIENNLASPYDTMIVCEVDGTLAGNCQLSCKPHWKNRHRAMVMIALLKEYWNLGIGTAMFREMIRLAKEKGIERLELEVIEGNEHAMHLYEKMGFRVISSIPDAIRLKDGTRLREYYMIKEL